MSLLPGYETTIITKNEMADSDLEALKKKLSGAISSMGGKVVYQEDWGKRKLAYHVGKESRGHYTYLVYNGKPGVSAEVERNLRINESVMRFLTVQLGKEFDEDGFLKKTPVISPNNSVSLPARPSRPGRDRSDRSDRE